jgi:twitching motility protein PilT
MEIQNLLRETVIIKGSDLHLSVGLRPMVRLYGNLKALDHPVLQISDMEQMLQSILSPALFSKLQKEGQVDFAYEIPGIGRFRGNGFRQARGLSGAFRAIPQKIIPLESLGLPEQVRQQCQKRAGLILVTGPTGSGKSTTLAAIVDHLNQTKKSHILTIEDPIEFVHQSKLCLIHQRQIGEHSQTFAAALRAALREDPDIILVGEMRDLETIELALTAAETGHLVLGTLHTRGAAKTLDRIISVFPSNQQNQVRTMAAESIRAIVSQVLLTRTDQLGMIAAYEILIMTPGIQNLVRETKIYQIPSAIQTGSRLGMRSMEQSLKKLILEKIITAESAQEYLTTSITDAVDEVSGSSVHSQSEIKPKPVQPQKPPQSRTFFRLPGS